MLRTLLTLTATVLAGCGREPVQPAELPASPLERGRVLTAWFHEGRTEELWSRFSPELRAVFGSESGLRRFRAEVERGAGTEGEVMEERVIPWLEGDVYSRTAAWTRSAVPVRVEWTSDARGTVLGMLVEPARTPAESRFLDRPTVAELLLPVTGEWFVFWGGRTVVENYHAESRDQRFAVDLVVVRDGRTHAGDPQRNESYLCFGAPILAPADGVVAAAGDGVPDNRPSVMNAARPLGNHVVIDHGAGEFSFLAHLREGSVAVRPGARVRRGDAVGECGNSGNSSEPHLHFHLQTTAVFGEGEGLPAQFADYLADGAAVPRGEPARGQRIRPQ